MKDNLAFNDNINNKNKPESWLKNNVINPFLNNSAIEIYNTASTLINDVDKHVKIKEIKPLEQSSSKAYSASWFVQGLSAGAGGLVPYLIAGKLTDMALTPTAQALDLTANASQIANLSQIAGAGIWGLAAKPIGNESRLANSLSSMAGFAVFGAGNDLASKLSLTTKIMATPIIGFAGGSVMNITSDLVDKQKINLSDIAKAGTMGLAMNTLMPLLPIHSENNEVKVNPTFDAKAMANINDKVISETPDHSAIAKLYERSSVDNNYVSPQYPHPDDFGTLTSTDIQNRGFAALEELSKLQGEDFYKAPRPLPNPDTVANEVGKLVARIPNASDTGPLKIGEFNMEFLDADKARYFQKAYQQIVPKTHLLFGEEVNEGGLAQIAKDTGYNYYASRANSRGQGVGFLVNPRLEVNKVTSYDNVAKVDGIPDERPALRIDFTDKATNEKSSAIVVHLKSMRGGVERTSQVRFDQSNLLANDLEPDFKGIISGDFNTFLDNTHDTKPLYDKGFKLAFSGDHQSTQQMGGRLDGFFLKGIDTTPQNYLVTPFFKDPLITRGLSDHALVLMELNSLK